MIDSAMNMIDSAMNMNDSAMKFTLNYFPCVITIIPYIVNNFSIYCINKYVYLLITLLPPYPLVCQYI